MVRLKTCNEKVIELIDQDQSVLNTLIAVEERSAPARFARHNIRVGGFGNREAEVYQVVVGTIDGAEDKDGGYYHGGRLCYAQRKALNPIAVRNFI